MASCESNTQLDVSHGNTYMSVLALPPSESLINCDVVKLNLRTSYVWLSFIHAPHLRQLVVPVRNELLAS
jgi:hypothetical protein